MRFRNTPSSYGLVSIALHWLVALAIVGLFALGLWMVELSYADPWYTTAPWLHIGVGMLLGALIGVRLVWRLLQPRPAFEPGMRGWERAAALSAHWLMYAATVAVIASGYLITTADGSPVSVFGWLELPAIQLGIERQADLAGRVHYYGAWLLVLMAGGHSLAAIKHHVIDRDRTLIKMLRPER
jgi:cytochrome b561